MLAASVSLSVLGCWSTNLSHTFRILKVAFCKACCMLLTLRSALRLKLFIWSQISGLTLTVVISGQFSGLACLARSALSLSLGRVMPHRLDAMLAKRWFILAPTSSSSVKSASRDLRSSTSSLGSVVLAVTSASLGFDSSRNSFMSSSEGEILNSSSSRLRLPDASWSLSSD